MKQTARLPAPVETDLLLVFPPFFRRIVSLENLGIEYIAAAVRARGYRVTMINAGLHGLDVEHVIRLVLQSEFRVLGISILHWTLEPGLRIAAAAKRAHPDCHVVLGGIEAALRAMEVALHPSVDSVVCGEGEYVTGELLDCFSSGADWRRLPGLAYRVGDDVVVRPPAERIQDLDALPFPARDDLAAVLDSGGPAAVSTSRGCFGRCTFCSVVSFYGLSEGPAWRARSPGSVVSEIGQLYDDHGVRLFSFIDETVVGSRRRDLGRLRELAAHIREAGLDIRFFATVRADQVEPEVFRELAAAGLAKVEIGIESMADSQLRRFGKVASIEDNRRALQTLDDLGIQVEAYMIPFDADVTWSEIHTNFEFFRNRFSTRTRGYDVGPLGVGDYLYPYHGTRARKRYLDEHWIPDGPHVPFLSPDPAITSVQRVIHRFIAHTERAFPLSYMGFGNLWVNGGGLPSPIFDAVCGVGARYGQLILDLAEWVRGTVGSPMGLAIEAAELRDSLRGFVTRAASLHEELRVIHACLPDRFRGDVQHASGGTFAADLQEYGRYRRQTIIDNVFAAPWEVEAICDNLLEVLSASEAKMGLLATDA